ncbi:AI-2E family transporter [Eubacterium sp.]|uniref:AI-2E family transporter n=1 Tax=Eubacterium sp. TaxID=142586 RepID=UPI0025881977|nr:AI-2E family transporter [Eubacterium sp.]MCR5368416.1 AI-2E family transporter [Eubacterium sp.]
MGKKWSNEDWKKCSVLAVSLCIVVTFYMLLGKLPGVLKFLGMIIGAFTPIIMGCVIAFLLTPVMNFFKGVFSKLFIKIMGEKKKLTAVKVANVMAVAISLIILLSIVVGLLMVLIPELQRSITMLSNEIPNYIDNAKAWLKNLSFLKKYPKIYEAVSTNLDKIQDNLVKIIADKLLPNIDTIVVKISTGIIGGVKFVFNFFVGIIIAAYILYSKERLSANGKKMIFGVFKKKAGTVVLDSLSFMNNVFGGFIDGKILDSLIIGVICAVFCLFVDMPYAILVSVTVGITNIIPFFGPFIGAVPCSLLILVADPLKCLIFVIFILILQQIDGNILGPLILGDSTGLSGLWVMVAILVGGNLFGFIGMLLGVPVLACVYALINVIIDGKLKKQNLSTATDYYLTLHGFDEKGEPIRVKRQVSAGNDRRSRKQNKKRKNSKDIMETRENIREKVGMNIENQINSEKVAAVEENSNAKTNAATHYNEYLKKNDYYRNRRPNNANRKNVIENEKKEPEAGKKNYHTERNNADEQNIKKVQNVRPNNHKTNITRNKPVSNKPQGNAGKSEKKDGE